MALWLAVAAPALSQESEPMPDAPYQLPAHDWDDVATLQAEFGPAPFTGWSFGKRLSLRNPTSDDRVAMPVEVDVSFHADQLTDPAHEVRVAATGGGGQTEIPSQIHVIDREDDILRCRLFFLADVTAGATATFLVYYGNPQAESPAYETDLTVSGQGVALQIANEHYRVDLAPSNGHLKSLYSQTGSVAFVGHGPPMMGGHGVEGTIHWGPDWSDEHVGRYRVTNWDSPSHFDHEVLRGPVCVRVRRWGHPILAVGPQVGRPHKVRAVVTYTFFAGQPWLEMSSQLHVLQDIRFRDCRNDEWVVGSDLDEAAWMDAGGTLGFGGRGWSGQDPRWWTFFDRASGQGFGSLHLEYENTNPAWDGPQTAAIQDNRIWVRYPVRHAAMHAGDVVHERNAYLLHRFEEGGADGGFADLSGHYRRLMKPPHQVEAPPAPKAVTVANVSDALHATTDFELYVQGSPAGANQLSVIDLGMVRHIAVDGQDVRVDLIMPYSGRRTWFGWFAERVETQVRQRLREVGDVDVREVTEPAWTPTRLNERARRTIGPAD